MTAGYFNRSQDKVTLEITLIAYEWLLQIIPGFIIPGSRSDFLLCVSFFCIFPRMGHLLQHCHELMFLFPIRSWLWYNVQFVRSFLRVNMVENCGNSADDGCFWPYANMRVRKKSFISNNFYPTNQPVG